MGTATRNWLMLLSSKVNETAARLSCGHLVISVRPARSWIDGAAEAIHPVMRNKIKITRLIQASCFKPGADPCSLSITSDRRWF
jgi:hypothetical protein